MSVTRNGWIGLLGVIASAIAASAPANAQQQRKPNILFIMGDDIGWMQPSIYHRGLMVGETPNIDRIGNEGASSWIIWPSSARVVSARLRLQHR